MKTSKFCHELSDDQLKQLLNLKSLNNPRIVRTPGVFPGEDYGGIEFRFNDQDNNAFFLAVGFEPPEDLSQVTAEYWESITKEIANSVEEELIDRNPDYWFDYFDRKRRQNDA